MRTKKADGAAVAGEDAGRATVVRPEGVLDGGNERADASRLKPETGRLPDNSFRLKVL